MKKTSLYVASVIFVAILGDKVQAGGSGDEKENVTTTVLGIDPATAVKYGNAADSAGKALENTASKAISSGNKTAGYSTDNKIYADNVGVTIPLFIGSILKFAGDFYSGTSGAIFLVRDGINGLKKAGTKVGGKDQIAAVNKLTHGLSLLDAQKVYYMAGNFHLYLAAQYFASKQNPVIHFKDIKKILDEIRQLNEDKKKLISSQTGVVRAVTEVRDALNDLLGSEEMDEDIKDLLTKAVKMLDYTVEFSERLWKFLDLLLKVLDGEGPSGVADELKKVAAIYKAGAGGSLEKAGSAAKSSKKTDEKKEAKSSKKKK
ncbi:MAG: hypothetical protein LBJ16_00360 [Holosporaceae bacterium]|jgi:hypothetical protein|nr:hypothetical protein [Holosporaceae bacterium]